MGLNQKHGCISISLIITLFFPFIHMTVLFFGHNWNLNMHNFRLNLNENPKWIIRSQMFVSTSYIQSNPSVHPPMTFSSLKWPIISPSDWKPSIKSLSKESRGENDIWGVWKLKGTVCSIRCHSAEQSWQNWSVKHINKRKCQNIQWKTLINCTYGEK